MLFSSRLLSRSWWRISALALPLSILLTGIVLTGGQQGTLPRAERETPSHAIVPTASGSTIGDPAHRQSEKAADPEQRRRLLLFLFFHGSGTHPFGLQR